MIIVQGWIEGLQSSIDFIEQHLTDELDIEEIAGKAALSPFYYQRIFGALCGCSAPVPLDRKPRKWGDPA